MKDPKVWLTGLALWILVPYCVTRDKMWAEIGQGCRSAGQAVSAGADKAKAAIKKPEASLEEQRDQWVEECAKHRPLHDCYEDAFELMMVKLKRLQADAGSR